MTKQKQSKSARIRKMLEQGKTVKQITAIVHCTAQMVYQVRSKELSKLQKTHQTPVNHTNTVRQPAVIYRAEAPILPKDYAVQKPGFFKRIANWFTGV